MTPNIEFRMLRSGLRTKRQRRKPFVAIAQPQTERGASAYSRFAAPGESRFAPIQPCGPSQRMMKSSGHVLEKPTGMYVRDAWAVLSKGGQPLLASCENGLTEWCELSFWGSRHRIADPRENGADSVLQRVLEPNVRKMRYNYRENRVIYPVVDFLLARFSYSLIMPVICEMPSCHSTLGLWQDLWNFPTGTRRSFLGGTDSDCFGASRWW